MKDLLILVDVDGVIADFVQGVLDVVYQETGLLIYPADITEWDFLRNLDSILKEKGLSNAISYAARIRQRVLQPGFCAGLKPFPEAVETLNKLKEKCKVTLLTTPFFGNPYWKEERTVWAQKHLGRVDVVHIRDKSPHWGDVFIDDKPDHVRAWGKRWSTGPVNASPALLWDTHQNRSTTDLRRITTWSEVTELIEAQIHGLPGSTCGWICPWRSAGFSTCTCAASRRSRARRSPPPTPSPRWCPT